jgi:hypothetical protein
MAGEEGTMGKRLTIFNCGGYDWCGWRFARYPSVMRHLNGGGLGVGGQGTVDDLG